MPRNRKKVARPAADVDGANTSVAATPPSTGRKDEILQAALRVFAKKGYKAATNKDIAAEAGVTTAALYYYFPSKEAMFDEVLAARKAPLKDVRAALNDFGDLPPDKLLPLALSVVSTVAKQAEALQQGRFIITSALHDPKVAAHMYENFFRPMAGEFRTYFEHQIALGNMRAVDPGLAAASLLAPVFGLVIWRVLIGEIPEVPWDPVLRFSLDEYLAWIRPTGDPAAAPAGPATLAPAAPAPVVPAPAPIPWISSPKEGDKNG